MKLLAALLTFVFFLAAGGGEALAYERLVIFAAASVKEALDEINAAYKQAKAIDMVVSYGSSGQLIKQIVQGAPAEIFISADLESMDYGAEKKAIRETTRLNLLGNRLVLVASTESPIVRVAFNANLNLASLAGDGRIATGDVRSVPVGRYAQAALQKLGQWDAVRPKLAMADNVRVALSLVARGEAPLGIVYETDARIEPKVKIVGAFPADSYPPIVYPAALTAMARPTAADYLAFLQSAAARAIFEKRGFTLLARAS